MKSLTKAFILLAVMLFAGINASAQLLPISLEVRGGTNVSTMSIKDYNTNSRTGFNAGLAAQLRLPASFFVESGLMLTNKGANRESVVGNQTLETRINTYYLQVPALVGYKIRLIPMVRLKLFGGLYAAQGIGGRMTLPDGSRQNSFSSSNLQRFDMGLVGGIGAEITRFTLNIGYEHGLIDVSQTSANVKNRNTFISLGFRMF